MWICLFCTFVYIFVYSIYLFVLNICLIWCGTKHHNLDNIPTILDSFVLTGPTCWSHDRCSWKMKVRQMTPSPLRARAKTANSIGYSSKAMMVTRKLVYSVFQFHIQQLCIFPRTHVSTPPSWFCIMIQTASIWIRRMWGKANEGSDYAVIYGLLSRQH